jgi:hypothetical protein
MGWTAEELFGVDAKVGVVRVDAAGALMVSGGTPVQEVYPDCAQPALVASSAS